VTKKYKYFWQFSGQQPVTLEALERLNFLRIARDLTIDKIIYKSPGVWAKWKVGSTFPWGTRGPKYIWDNVLHNERYITKLIFKANWHSLE
jgi:hypothetical protein